MMHERNPRPTWIISERVRMPCAEFQALRIIDGNKPTDLPPGSPCRALICGRWHQVHRQYVFGIPHFYARPIVVIADSKSHGATSDRAVVENPKDYPPHPFEGFL